MDTRICILEQNAEAYENAKIKNRFIQSTDAEWLGFVDGEVTSKQEISQLLEENPVLMEYDVILFGKDVPEGECGFFQLFEYPQCTIYALCFRKSLLVQTGSYNQYLSGNVTYEFLLRLAEKGSVYSVPCSADKMTAFNPVTMAYVMRHHMNTLKEYGKLDVVFLNMVQLAERLGAMEQFSNAMNCFLNKPSEYEKIAADTAPCFIFVSDEKCYGVVAGFADSLADELVGLGQAVITTNGRYGDYLEASMEQILFRQYKAIIGFQSPALESDTFRQTKGQRYQFWFDNPVFSDEFLRKTDKRTYFLCQDAYYAKYIREHYDIVNVVQFPPAGDVVGSVETERLYDLVFVGTYMTLPKADYEDAAQRELYQYMMSHPDYTFEQGIRMLGQKQGIVYDERQFMEKVRKLQNVFFDVLQSYRHSVVETILSAGIQLHVFGESWRAYRGAGHENLVIHPSVHGEEMLHTLAQAKIGLNIMNGHKAGMTERIANIMLCGACCLSDETYYLQEHFRDGENIVLYSGNAIEQLPDKIRYLLQHDKEREKIALAGREVALREHTWRKRAEELLEIMDGRN